MKLEFKGTPGPWAVMTDDFDGHCVINPTSDFGIEFIAKNIQQGYDDGEADANLIAAAPDLLEAAIDFIEKVDTGRARSTDSYNKFKLAVHRALNIEP